MHCRHYMMDQLSSSKSYGAGLCYQRELYGTQVGTLRYKRGRPEVENILTKKLINRKQVTIFYFLAWCFLKTFLIILQWHLVTILCIIYRS
jgi:hypothetical protein